MESKLLPVSNGHLSISPTLATNAGLNEAMILQYVHSQLSSNTQAFQKNGRMWIGKTIDEIHLTFSFFSERTIRRAIKSATDQGLLIVEHHADCKYDRTNYYSIDYEKLMTAV